MPICTDCGQPLSDANWSPSNRRTKRYVCRPCAVARVKNYEAQHAGRRARYNRGYYETHKADFAARSRAYQKAHPEKAREWARRSARKNRAKCTARHREWANRNRELLAKRAKAKRDALRAETLAAYGGVCACPGCTEHRAEFLAIDHTHGDGSAHRREVASGKPFGGTRIYLWLKKRGFPQDRFRLLCHNCNLARGLYGYCPHEREQVTQAH